MDQLTNRYERINVRLRIDEKRRILQICDQFGISQSDLIRLMVLDDEKLLDKMHTVLNRDSVVSVNRCGNNLNQIAKKLNSGEIKILSPKGFAVLNQHMNAIERLLAALLKEAQYR